MLFQALLNKIQTQRRKSTLSRCQGKVKFVIDKLFYIFQNSLIVTQALYKHQKSFHLDITQLPSQGISLLYQSTSIKHKNEKQRSIFLEKKIPDEELDQVPFLSRLTLNQSLAHFLPKLHKASTGRHTFSSISFLFSLAHC
jgi:hypothetical protein